MSRTLKGPAAKLCVTAGLAASLTATRYAQPAAAGGGDGFSHHISYNMCGNLCNDAGTSPASYIDSRVSSMDSDGHPVLAISVQELCDDNTAHTSQYEYLVSHLPEFAVYFALTVDRSAVPNTDCDLYGIGVAPRSTHAAGSHSHTYSLPEPTGYPGVNWEDRKVICADEFNGNKWINVCSTHLTNEVMPTPPGEPGAFSQAIEARNVVDGFFTDHGGSGKFVGGDFNMTPTEVASETLWYSDFDEADNPNNAKTFSTTGSLIKKLDYTFGAEYLYEGSPSYAVVRTHSSSDHKLIEGHFDPED